MKTKTFAFLIAICLFALCGVFFVSNESYALTESSFLSVSDETAINVEEYTDSDLLLPVETSNLQDRELVEYKSTLYSEYITNYTCDNPIVQIVPREFFENKGQYFYIGKEYGFFVYTRENTQFGNSSTVYVFDITYDLSLEENDFAVVEITPLFCYEFYYLTSENNFQYKQEIFTSGEFMGYDGIFNLAVSEGLNDIVVAAKFIDTRNSESGFVENNNYFLKDVVFNANIYNEHRLNVGDEGYSVNEDNGSFFTSINTQFKATNINSSNDLTITYLGATAGLVFDLLPGLDAIKATVSFADYAAALDKANSELVSEVSNIKSNTSYDVLANEMFNSKQSQIANYGRLIRSAYAGITSSEDDPILFSTKQNHFIQAKFKVSHTADTAWQTRFVSNIAAQIVRLSTNQNIVEVAKCEGEPAKTPQFLRGQSEESLTVNIGNNDLYILPYGKACYTFLPVYSSKYIFYSEMSENMIAVIKHLSETIQVDYESNGFSVFLEKDKVYDIEIKIADNSVALNENLHLEMNSYVDQAIIHMPPNCSNIFIKYQSSTSGAFHLTANNGALIGAIYDENWEQINFEPYNEYKDFYFDNQKFYYIELKNPSQQNKTVSIQKSEVSEFQKTNSINQIAKISYFIAPTEGTYIFYCKEKVGWLKVVFYKENGTVIAPETVLMENNTILGYAIYLEKNEKIFVGLSTQSSEFQTLNFELDVDTKVIDWYVNDANIASGDSVSIKRGEVFKAEVFLNGENISHLIYAGSTFQKYQQSTNYWKNTEGQECGFHEMRLKGDYASKVFICLEYEFDDFEFNVINENGKVFLTWGLMPDVTSITFEVLNNSKTVFVDKNVAQNSLKIDITNQISSIASNVAVINVKLKSITIEYLSEQNTITDFLINCENKNVVCGFNRYFAGGEGTSENPFTISTFEHFSNINKITYHDDIDGITFVTGYYKLLNNITLSSSWSPIGFGTDGFNGNFNGNGYSVSNAASTINNPGSLYHGVFTFNWGTISNLTVNVNFRITKTLNTYDYVAVGGVCGANNGTLERVNSYGSITTTGRVYSGGIVGLNNRTVLYSYSYVTITGGTYIGGIAATSSGTMDGVFFDGIINYNQYYITSIVKYNCIGGLIGEMFDGGTIDTSGFYGEINVLYKDWYSTSYQPRIGGIIGRLSSGTMGDGCDIESSKMNYSNLNASKNQRMYVKSYIGQTV